MRRSEDKEEKFGGYDVLGADAIATIPLLLATVALVLVTTREVAMVGGGSFGHVACRHGSCFLGSCHFGGVPTAGCCPIPF